MTTDSNMRKVNAILVLALLFAFFHYLHLQDRISLLEGKVQRLQNWGAHANLWYAIAHREEKESARLQQEIQRLQAENDNWKKMWKQIAAPITQSPRPPRGVGRAEDIRGRLGTESIPVPHSRTRYSPIAGHFVDR